MIDILPTEFYPQLAKEFSAWSQEREKLRYTIAPKEEKIKILNRRKEEAEKQLLQVEMELQKFSA